ncbi:type II/IV secretion system ATPase subunit [Halegenticoccus tardaugens]|uniref:type II/IV secretion system ATPase subunit n=1 Tax=Halegenticoccus tardaugens TaxID=2071624 RepID=UPI00100A7B22|nr:type II/IV secretion system ATPase subunit [Halegenticoccus tardaugens]
MAVDDAGDSNSGRVEGGAATEAHREDAGAAVGEYTWEDYLAEYGPSGAAADLSQRMRRDSEGDRRGGDGGPRTPDAEDWQRVGVDPTAFLGFHPDDLSDRVGGGGLAATRLHERFEAFCDPETTPVVKDAWLWEHYKREYYYDEAGDAPRDGDGETVPFDPAAALGFDPDRIENVVSHLGDRADALDEVIAERTVNVDADLDEDAFFSTTRGATTVANRYDLEKAVPMAKKAHFREVERYWVKKPHAFVVVFHSEKENEKKYYLVEPYRNRVEADLTEFLTGKLRTSIKYADDEVVVSGEDDRRDVIERETHRLLDRYDLYARGSNTGLANALGERLGVDGDGDGIAGRVLRRLGWRGANVDDGNLDGIAARPEPAVLAEDAAELTEYQVEKLLYYLARDFIGYERIDGIKHDINVEDISCDGYDSPVFVYHGDYEQIITNVYHGEAELDDFVVKLAQRSGKGISKRKPQVDATLPDGSRAQLTLGREVSDHGTNYTIRQFKDVPFTPIDLINWRTFSLDEMAFLWLCIENNKSLIFAGGTASGKTTSLNAVSLFIPSNTKIVSIEDTREVELPQRNWIASVTRPSFSDDDKGDVDEFDLLEAALRQRPDYIVMGEIRGEEGRTLFQVMSTGHTTYTTFHADSVGEVLKRFTTDPINVSKTMFTALDLVSIQTSTRVQGTKVRRNKSITEINHYDAENDEINVRDVYQWQAETDEFLEMGASNTLSEITFDRGWSRETLDEELFERRVVLAYLIENGLNTYTQVAATFQAFINDPDTILTLMANGGLERSLEDLREMESVLIDIDPEKEEMVPRPDPDAAQLAEAESILERAEEELFEAYRGEPAESVANALTGMRDAPDVTAGPTETRRDDAPANDSSADDASTADDAPAAAPDRDAESAADEVAAIDGDGWDPATFEPADGTDNAAPGFHVDGEADGGGNGDPENGDGETVDGRDDDEEDEAGGDDASESDAIDEWGFGEFEDDDGERT